MKKIVIGGGCSSRAVTRLVALAGVLLVCSLLSAALPSRAFAYLSGSNLPMLGMSVHDSDGYQFKSGAYYKLVSDGVNVIEVPKDSNWNIHWVQDDAGANHKLTLRNASIKSALFVPGNTTIRVQGVCSITAPETAIQVRTTGVGNLTIDISGALALRGGSDVVFNCGDGNKDGTGGSISIGSTDGGSFTCEGVTSSGAIKAGGALSFTGSVDASIVSTSNSAALSTASKQPIVVSDAAKVTVDGAVTSGGDLFIKDKAVFSLISKAERNLQFGHKSRCVVEQGAALNVDTQGRGLFSFNGSVEIAGSASIKAGPTNVGIALGSRPGDFSYSGAGDVAVTGSLEISRAKNAIQNFYGSVRVNNGGFLTICGEVDSAFVFPCGGGVYLDGGVIDVSGVQKGIGSLMLASDKIIPCKVEAKNGSALRMQANSHLFVDQAPEDKPIMAFEFSDSTIEFSSGAKSLAILPPGRSLPLTTAYTKDCNVYSGATADNATKRPLDALSLDGISYLSISPAGKDWTQDAHQWASAWSSDDTHHWHACESSFCTLGDDVTAMDGYGAHDFASVTPNGDATCTDRGTETATCACGKTQVRPAQTGALGHDFSGWTVAVKPTCMGKGVEERACSRCDAVETRSIEPLGHVYEDGVCTVCGVKDPTYNPIDPGKKPEAPESNKGPAKPELPATGDMSLAVPMLVSGAAAVITMIGAAIGKIESR